MGAEMWIDYEDVWRAAAALLALKGAGLGATCTLERPGGVAGLPRVHRLSLDPSEAAAASALLGECGLLPPQGPGRLPWPQ